jgi:3-oxoacyl-[acyl-carrier-protein] synthase II
MSTGRAVITGLGAVSCLGLTSSRMWEGLCDGICGIGPIKAFDPANFPCKFGGEVAEYSIRDFVPKSHRKATKLMCRDIELAAIAADEAFKMSGLVTKGIDETKVSVEPTRMAAVIGAGLISCEIPELVPAIQKSITNGKFDIHKWGREGLPLITPLWLLKYLPNMLACHIGIIHDLQGPSNSITCGEASSHIAISEARDIIARGSADVALAGGGEAKLNPFTIMRQCLLGRTTPRGDDAASACRPFDAAADGSIFGDGAGLIVMEDLEYARKRGAKMLAEVLGTGESNNISPAFAKLEPSGKGLELAIRKALAEAHTKPEELDMIIPHGTGIPTDDATEATAIAAALGQAAEKIPALPTKSMLSNTGAAAGGLDIVAAVCAVRDGFIPAAKNCQKKAGGCRLNINAQLIRKKVRRVLCCGYTYGAQTAAIIIGAVE